MRYFWRWQFNNVGRRARPLSELVPTLAPLLPGTRQDVLPTHYFVERTQGAYSHAEAIRMAASKGLRALVSGGAQEDLIYDAPGPGMSSRRGQALGNLAPPWDFADPSARGVIVDEAFARRLLKGVGNARLVGRFALIWDFDALASPFLSSDEPAVSVNLSNGVDFPPRAYHAATWIASGLTIRSALVGDGVAGWGATITMELDPCAVAGVDPDGVPPEVARLAEHLPPLAWSSTFCALGASEVDEARSRFEVGRQVLHAEVARVLQEAPSDPGVAMSPAAARRCARAVVRELSSVGPAKLGRAGASFEGRARTRGGLSWFIGGEVADGGVQWALSVEGVAIAAYATLAVPIAAEPEAVEREAARVFALVLTVLERVDAELTKRFGPTPAWHVYAPNRYTI